MYRVYTHYSILCLCPAPRTSVSQSPCRPEEWAPPRTGASFGKNSITIEIDLSAALENGYSFLFWAREGGPARLPLYSKVGSKPRAARRETEGGSGGPCSCSRIQSVTVPRRQSSRRQPGIRTTGGNRSGAYWMRVRMDCGVVHNMVATYAIATSRSGEIALSSLLSPS